VDAVTKMDIEETKSPLDDCCESGTCTGAADLEERNRRATKRKAEIRARLGMKV
jgi:hypothetical protein